MTDPTSTAGALIRALITEPTRSALASADAIARGSSMSDRSSIERTDATRNPARGCSRVSEGCRHCYAERGAAPCDLPGWPRALRAELAAAYLGLSRSMLHALVARGEAPRPTYLTRATPVWLRDELDAWLDARAGRAPASAKNSWDEALAGGNDEA